MRKALIGAGGQINGAALLVLLLKKMQQGAIIGKAGDIEGDRVGDIGFECGFTVQQRLG